MIPSNQMEEIIGHLPGAVCPFALNEGVQVYMDDSLKRFNILYTAGGSLNSTIKLSLEELVEHASPVEWIDVCKGWLANE